MPSAVLAKSPRTPRPPAAEFRSALLEWYDVHKRDLPWRQDRNPYRVWLSEIMLQQTRVAAVLEHYRKFLERFPNVQTLAAARESTVLAAWSGLGYYRRARMLHAAARVVMRQHKGTFPGSSEEWQNLPGIGRYTAAAVASIAFNEPVAVVDGNVARVLSRLYGRNLESRESWEAAANLLALRRPGDFNQAMMELGATVCVPRQPLCLSCPVFSLCASQGDSPRPRRKPAQTKRQIDYALHCRNGSVFLCRRPGDASLMPGMWELPEIANPEAASKVLLTLRHSITVTDYIVRVRQCVPQRSQGRWVTSSRARGLPLTGLARKILRVAGII